LLLSFALSVSSFLTPLTIWHFFYLLQNFCVLLSLCLFLLSILASFFIYPSVCL
jgi:hypothetical protein